MLCHSLQASASRHMDKQQPQLRVHALPHRGLSLPGWWRNSMLPASPKREPRATACSAREQDEGNRSSAEDSGEPSQN